jgi:hypothetical protein
MSVDTLAACTRLVADFAFFVDQRDAEAVTALFTSDGIFERRGTALTGRAAILAAQRARPPEFVTRHACTNIRIDVIDDTHARGTCMFVLYRMPAIRDEGTAATGDLPFTIGDYEDSFTFADGAWRFSRRVAHILYQRSA